MSKNSKNSKNAGDVVSAAKALFARADEAAEKAALEAIENENFKHADTTAVVRLMVKKRVKKRIISNWPKNRAYDIYWLTRIAEAAEKGNVPEGTRAELEAQFAECYGANSPEYFSWACRESGVGSVPSPFAFRFLKTGPTTYKVVVRNNLKYARWVNNE